jgi:hypothetical protein
LLLTTLNQLTLAIGIYGPHGGGGVDLEFVHCSESNPRHSKDIFAERKLSHRAPATDVLGALKRKFLPNCRTNNLTYQRCFGLSHL